MGDGGIADGVRVRTEHPRAGAAAILVVYCLSAACAGVVVAAAVLKIVDIVHPF